MSVKLRLFLYGVEIHAPAGYDEVGLVDQVPRKGDHLAWNGMLLEVMMVVWTPAGVTHLYLAKEPFDKPPPPGLEDPCDTSSPP